MVRVLFYNDKTVYNIPLGELQKVSFFKKLPGLTEETELNLGEHNKDFTYGNLIKCIGMCDTVTGDDLMTSLLDFLGEESKYCSVSIIETFKKSIDTLCKNKKYDAILQRCLVDSKYVFCSFRDIVNNQTPLGVIKKIINTVDKNTLYLWLRSMYLSDCWKNTEYEKKVRKLLIEKGANIDYVYPDLGQTILHSCIISGNIEHTKWVLDDGADPNILTRFETPPLLLCSSKIGMAELLLEHGVDINAQNNRGETLLMLVVYNCDYTYTRFLLERGADVHIMDNHYQDVFSKVDVLSSMDINDLLLEYRTPLV